MTSQTPPTPGDKKFPYYRKLREVEEAKLIWEEYKYRHDLIWRYLISSTLVLVALITVRYSDLVNPPRLVLLLAWFAAVIYWFIIVIVVEGELKLFYKIKKVHRARQTRYFKLQFEETAEFDSRRWGIIFLKNSFSRRVGIYLLLLLFGTLIAGPIIIIVR